MFNKNKIILSIFLFLLSTQTTWSQVTFYDLNTIQKIEIYFSQSNWDYQMDTAKYGADGYVIADWVKINGIQFDSAGVKYKGNSSYDSTYTKNPIHIELDNTIPQSYQGIADIKLGNGYADPSMIREVLAYDILKNYMDCPRSNFAQLYINGNYIGVYSNDESINKDFLSTHFNSSSKTFFKCNPITNPGPTTKSSLRYIPLADSTAYFNFYELKSTYGWDELVKLCDTVTNYPSSLYNTMDLDRVMWMLAFNSVLVNLDSYTGVFCQNYYLYKDKTDRFNPIVWDLNMAFGGFPYVGSGNTSMGSLSITNMQQLSPTFHATDPYWPLINAVMNDASLKKQYIAHARTITNENFVNNSYLTTASQLHSVVDTAVQSDNNKFYTYSQFQGGLNTDYSVGSYMVPGISNLMGARVSYLQSNPDFQFVPPSISNVNVSNNNPALNDVVTISATVTNTNSSAVYLGFRMNTDEKFVRWQMFDDGAHNDGVAGDNVYGNSITINSFLTQYYIYAENNDAAMFSPERAEHEFYSIVTQSNSVTAGQVVINEFLASNASGQLNEIFEYADWIELYNNTSTPLSLYGLYLTDDITNPTKYAFPSNTTIPANGFLMLFADEGVPAPTGLHCNFKLSANGEFLMLGNGTSLVLDSITFGPQLDDISVGRCPNGYGNYVTLQIPSYNNYNCSTSLFELDSDERISIYPNPAKDEFVYTINSNSRYDQMIIRDCLGKSILNFSISEKGTIDIKTLGAGIYILNFINTQTGRQQVEKIVKL
ncbi:MAG TPA: CotH kinase family protein [Bacteroidia bacterium]|nr:CotH kinase family protein [Bacteroidia bacterium]